MRIDRASEQARSVPDEVRKGRECLKSSQVGIRGNQQIEVAPRISVPPSHRSEYSEVVKSVPRRETKE